MLPTMMYLNIHAPNTVPVRLWLPLFLLWPLVFILLAIPLLFAAVVDVALWMAGQRYHHYSLLIVKTIALLGEMRGMVVRIRNKESVVDMTID